MWEKKKKIMWKCQGKHIFWFFLVKSGMIAFSFSFNQVISRNDVRAQMHKQDQPQVELRRKGKRGPALTSSGEKNRDEDWYTGERNLTTAYNVEPLHSLKFLFLPLEFNTKQ